MNHTETEHSSRLEAAIAAQRRHTLRTFPHLQAKAVAEHYCKMASMARDLLQLEHYRERAGLPSPGADSAIAYLVAEISKHHLKDLGLPLDWTEEE